MQSKRKKRSKIRAAKVTAGHGSKKKNRGAGHRGGRGKAGAGKRGDAKLMKVTKGIRTMGKHGFKSMKSSDKAINLQVLQEKLDTLFNKNQIKLDKYLYIIDLTKLGYDKLLSKGTVTRKMHIKVKTATKRSISKVEAAGGKVEHSG